MLTEEEACTLLADEGVKLGHKIAAGTKLNSWDHEKHRAILAWISGDIETEAAAIQVQRANNYRDLYVQGLIEKRNDADIKR